MEATGVVGVVCDSRFSDDEQVWHVGVGLLRSSDFGGYVFDYDNIATVGNQAEANKIARWTSYLRNIPAYVVADDSVLLLRSV